MEIDQHALMLFRSEKLRPEDFTHSDTGCLLGKAGRARFYGEWEPLAARLRKLLAESVSDVTSAIGQAAAATTTPVAGSDGQTPAAAAAPADPGDDF
ncbi:MAG: hypothetical protein AW07_04751 [Candidatus Accumulibacter sp. SK-11]|nr:MAG: hypothetical protein AW07_04751 [Candidatus Accumulibacter sp. SK-11]